MQPSAEFLLTLAAIAAAWLSVYLRLRAIEVALIKIEGDPERDRIAQWDQVVASVARAIDDPVARARDSLERRG